RPPDDQDKITVRALNPDDLRKGKGQGSRQLGASDEDVDGGKPSVSIKAIPDVPPIDSTIPAADSAATEPAKRKKPWVLSILNSDQQTRVFFQENEGDDEYETLIQKSEIEPLPEKPTAAPDKGSTSTP